MALEAPWATQTVFGVTGSTAIAEAVIVCDGRRCQDDAPSVDLKVPLLARPA